MACKNNTITYVSSSSVYHVIIYAIFASLIPVHQITVLMEAGAAHSNWIAPLFNPNDLIRISFQLLCEVLSFRCCGCWGLRRWSPEIIASVAFCALSKARWGVHLPWKFISPFSLALGAPPSPPHTYLCGYSSFCGQQPPSLTRHMFYRPLKHNAPLLFDIDLFIYFPVLLVSPYERLGAPGFLRHDPRGVLNILPAFVSRL